MADTTPRKRAEIISSFSDAGTGESHAAGEAKMLDPGVFANYEHAGLVRAAPPAKQAAKKAAAPKCTRTIRAKAPAPAPSLASRAAGAAAAEAASARLKSDTADT